MKLMGTLLVVNDIKKSTEFYQRVLKLKIVMNFVENITFDCGLSLQSKNSWKEFSDLTDEAILFKSNNTELYFETDDFDNYIKKLESFQDVLFLHDIKTYEWGQRGIRFYDLDGHIIEVGESMKSVCANLLKQGFSLEEVQQKTMYPIDFIKNCQ